MSKSQIQEANSVPQARRQSAEFSFAPPAERTQSQRVLALVGKKLRLQEPPPSAGADPYNSTLGGNRHDLWRGRRPR